MKQGLHLKLGHQLSMTPQLQQAIKLLQLSALELQQEIQQVLCSNPLLELADEIEGSDSDGAEGEAVAEDAQAASSPAEVGES